MAKLRLSSLLEGRKFWAVVLALVLILGGVTWHLRQTYEHDLQPVSVSSSSSAYFTISPGTSLHDIAVGLQNAGLIRSWAAFEWYVRSNELRDKLQAGTYKLTPAMPVSQIVHQIVTGQVAENLLTILPGKRLDQVEQAFKDAGYSSAEISHAFNPATYAGDPALIYLPPGRSLEGYLYPDSFQKATSTPATDIVRQSIHEMAAKLSTDIITGFRAQGLSVYQGLTLASIVEQESNSATNSPIMAQVFLLRLSQGMNLGSDVTAAYASVLAGQSFSVNINSPYNTRVHSGLPPGPIGTVSLTSLQAVAHPAHTTYLYFVTGDDGVTHFSYTQAQHDALVQQYCIKACAP